MRIIDVKLYGHCYHNQTFEKMGEEEILKLYYDSKQKDSRMDKFIDGNFVIILEFNNHEKLCITSGPGLPAFFYVKRNGDLDFVVHPSDPIFLENKPQPNKPFLDVVKKNERISLLYHNSHAYIPKHHSNILTNEIDDNWYMTPIDKCFLLPPYSTISIRNNKVYVKSTGTKKEETDLCSDDRFLRILESGCRFERGSLFLSGGLDSRAILSGLIFSNIQDIQLYMINQEGLDFYNIFSNYLSSIEDSKDKQTIHHYKILTSNITNQQKNVEDVISSLINERRTFGLGNPYIEINFFNSIMSDPFVINGGKQNVFHGFNENILNIKTFQSRKFHYGDYSGNPFVIRKWISHCSGELGSLGTFLLTMNNGLVTPYMTISHLFQFNQLYMDTGNWTYWMKNRVNNLKEKLQKFCPQLLLLPIISNTEGRVLSKVFNNEEDFVHSYIKRNYLEEIYSYHSTSANTKSKFTEMFMDSL